MIETKLGQNDAVSLGNSLDTWRAGTRGSSARVYESFYLNQDQQTELYAFKVMRYDKVAYATPLFLEEVKILSRLMDIDGVMKVKEIGFVRFDENCQFQSDQNKSQAHDMTGKILQMSLAESDEYVGQFSERIDEGWLPYLALQAYPVRENLLCLCDDRYLYQKNDGNGLPLKNRAEALVQACDILDIAHKRNIIFLDHKILHYYWRNYEKHVLMIDWNIGKYIEHGLSKDDRVKDLILFSVFTAFWALSGTPHPGTPEFLTSPDEILANAQPYKKDDNVLSRLPPPFREPIGKAMAGEYSDAAKLGMDLRQAIDAVKETK